MEEDKVGEFRKFSLMNVWVRLFIFIEFLYRKDDLLCIEFNYNLCKNNNDSNLILLMCGCSMN